MSFTMPEHLSLVKIVFSTMQLSMCNADQNRLVGSSGLEPPTSRLSGVCSNQLSYEPVWWR